MASSTCRLAYVVFQAGRLRGYVHRDLASDDFCATLPGLLVSPPSSEKIRHRRYQNRETFIVRAVVDGHQRELFLKCIHMKGYCHMLLVDALMPSMTHRYLALAHVLNALQIQTPAVVAVAEERSPIGRTRSFVLTEWIPNAVTLREFVASSFGRPRSRDDIAEWRAIFLRYAEIVQRLHAHRLFHFDLKPGNILISTVKPGEPDLTLVDLDAAVTSRMKAGPLPALLRFMDLLILHQHAYPFTDLKERLRFLAAYSGRRLSLKRSRRLQFFLLSSPVLLHTYTVLKALNLVHILRRLFLMLRLVR